MENRISMHKKHCLIEYDFDEKLKRNNCHTLQIEHQKRHSYGKDAGKTTVVQLPGLVANPESKSKIGIVALEVWI